MGVVHLVGILGISHCPLENDLYFTSFGCPSFETRCAAAFPSQDIPGFHVFVIKIWDVMVWMEGLDGIKSEDL